MSPKTTHARLTLAEYWLNKIEKIYSKDDDIIESYVEYFLVICRSIEDYMINDFLETLHPSIPMGERSDIILLKREYRKRKITLNHAQNQRIVNYLISHNRKVEKFILNPLVNYFRVLRNWTVHTIFPHIFENQYGDDETILHRYFQRNFVDYLELNSGGHLLLNSGSSLKLDSSDNDSIFDKRPLKNLNEIEKSQLESRLKSEEAMILLKEYLDLIKQFVENHDRIISDENNSLEVDT